MVHVCQIYHTELQLNKAISFATEAPFLDWDLTIANGIISSKIYDKRDYFNFEIVNFPFLCFTVYSFCESMFKC